MPMQELRPHSSITFRSLN